MIIEAIVESVIPFIGRLLGWIFIELLAHVVCYTTGFAVLKILTLGKYPRAFNAPFGEADQEVYVMLTGGIFWFGVLIYCLVT